MFCNVVAYIYESGDFVLLTLLRKRVDAAYLSPEDEDINIVSNVLLLVSATVNGHCSSSFDQSSVFSC